jgi:hypothetical protein
MEIFRQWGVEHAIRNRGLADGTDVFAMVERLTGRECGRTRPEPRGDQSPTWKSMVAQDAVEEELLRAVCGMGSWSSRLDLQNATRTPQLSGLTLFLSYFSEANVSV